MERKKERKNTELEKIAMVITIKSRHGKDQSEKNADASNHGETMQQASKYGFPWWEQRAVRTKKENSRSLW